MHLIYFSYGQKFNNRGEYGPYMPPANSVLALEGQQLIGKEFKFMGEAAVSSKDYLSRGASFIPITMGEHGKILLNYAIRGG